MYALILILSCFMSTASYGAAAAGEDLPREGFTSYYEALKNIDFEALAASEAFAHENDHDVNRIRREENRVASVQQMTVIQTLWRRAGDLPTMISDQAVMMLQNVGCSLASLNRIIRPFIMPRNSDDMMKEAQTDPLMQGLWPVAMCLQYIAHHALLFYDKAEEIRSGKLFHFSFPGSPQSPGDPFVLAYIKTVQGHGFVVTQPYDPPTKPLIKSAFYGTTLFPVNNKNYWAGTIMYNDVDLIDDGCLSLGMEQIQGGVFFRISALNHFQLSKINFGCRLVYEPSTAECESHGNRLFPTRFEFSVEKLPTENQRKFVPYLYQLFMEEFKKSIEKPMNDSNLFEELVQYLASSRSLFLHLDKPEEQEMKVLNQDRQEAEALFTEIATLNTQVSAYDAERQVSMQAERERDELISEENQKPSKKPSSGKGKSSKTPFSGNAKSGSPTLSKEAQREMDAQNQRLAKLKKAMAKLEILAATHAVSPDVLIATLEGKIFSSPEAQKELSLEIEWQARRLWVLGLQQEGERVVHQRNRSRKASGAQAPSQRSQTRIKDEDLWNEAHKRAKDAFFKALNNKKPNPLNLSAAQIESCKSLGLAFHKTQAGSHITVHISGAPSATVVVPHKGSNPAHYEQENIRRAIYATAQALLAAKNGEQSQH